MITKKNVEKYVVAGNYVQFLDYTKKKLKDDVFYIYVTGPDQLRGLSEISGVFIGSFEERKDIEEIRLQIKLIQGRKTWSPPDLNRHDKDYAEFVKMMMMASSMTQEQYKKISPTAFREET